MSWQNWFLIAYYVANIVTAVAYIGRPRKTMTALEGAVIVLLMLGLAWIGATA